MRQARSSRAARSTSNWAGAESSLSLCQTATFRTSVVAPRGARPLYARGPSAWHSPGHTPYPRYACIGP
ncbi:unnamed protein product [Lampetra planeri]